MSPFLKLTSTLLTRFFFGELLQLNATKKIDPNQVNIYHITHMDNLAGILKAGCLMSDSRRRRGDFSCTNIGHMHIKNRRMHRPVPVAAGGVLGDYVPFNYCARSVMLCAIYYKNVADYTGDQLSIVHLISTIGDAVRCGQPWAFTDRHAELEYACYHEDLAELSRIQWNVMPLRYWSNEKETRQAEFLVHDFFPWACVRSIGVHNSAVEKKVTHLLSQTTAPPKILLKPDWYYP